jgi:hypothetical protein
VRIAIVACLVACGKSPPAPSQGSGSGAWTCEQLPFAESTPVPEASGAAWLDGKLVIISDSGNHGAYGIVDPETGATTEQGKVEMGAWGDDFEGLATRGNTLYALLSGGHIIEYVRDAAGFRATSPPHPLGAVIPNAKKQGMLSDQIPAGDGMTCGPPTANNCGRNFEGLCLDDPAPAPAADPCVGFAAAKADGKLWCLRADLTVDPARSISVAKPGALADCAFDDHHRLWAGTNTFGGNATVLIEHWDDPPHAQVVPVTQLGAGFLEVIAVRGDVVYRMSDTGGSPSLMTKLRCTPPSR